MAGVLLLIVVSLSNSRAFRKAGQRNPVAGGGEGYITAGALLIAHY